MGGWCITLPAEFKALANDSFYLKKNSYEVAWNHAYNAKNTTSEENSVIRKNSIVDSPKQDQMLKL